MIEPNGNLYDDLVRNYTATPKLKVQFSYAMITKDGETSFDSVVEPMVGDRTIDFCSIDIDGLDLEVFQGFRRNMPTVVCIEGGQMFSPYDIRKEREVETQNMQQPLQVMRYVFASRGYELLCTHQDSFFMKRDVAEEFFEDEIRKSTLDLYFQGLLHHPRRIPWIQNQLDLVGERNLLLEEILRQAKVRKVHSGKEWNSKEFEEVLRAIIVTYKRHKDGV
jgi:hypothetical protein